MKPKIGVDQIARLKRGQRPTFTNEDLAEYTIVKRSADGSFTQSGPLDLRRANARVFSGNIPDKKNYHISAYRIRGGAVNPKDGKYYFAALVVKAQYIPAGRSPQVLNNMGAYLYRLDESNGWNVDFVGWYTIGRRETLQDSGSRTGDIAFNDNGDLYFLYQKADIGTEENKLDFLPAAELNRAAALSVAADAPINAQIDSFRQKEMAVGGGYANVARNSDQAVRPGGKSLNYNSARPGSGWTGQFGANGRSTIVTKGTSGFRLDGLADVGSGHLYIGGAFNGTGTNSAHRNVVGDFMPGKSQWYTGNTRVHDVQSSPEEIVDLAGCGKPDPKPVTLVLQKDYPDGRYSPRDNVSLGILENRMGSWETLNAVKTNGPDVGLQDRKAQATITKGVTYLVTEGNAVTPSTGNVGDRRHYAKPELRCVGADGTTSCPAGVVTEPQWVDTGGATRWQARVTIPESAKSDIVYLTFVNRPTSTVKIDLTVTKKLVTVRGNSSVGNAADPRASVQSASRWGDEQFMLQAGSADDNGTFADQQLATTTTTGTGSTVGNSTVTRQNLSFGTQASVGERLMENGNDVTVDPDNQIPGYEPFYYCALDPESNSALVRSAPPFTATMRSGIMTMRLPAYGSFRHSYLDRLRQQKQNVQVNCTIANVPRGLPITLTKVLDGGRARNGDQFDLTIANRGNSVTTRTTGSDGTIDNGTGTVRLPLARQGSVYRVDESPAGSTTSKQIQVDAPRADDPDGAAVTGTKTVLPDYRSVTECVVRMAGGRSETLEVKDYAFDENGGIAIHQGVRLPADKTGTVACTITNRPNMVEWSKVDAANNTKLLGGSVWALAGDHVPGGSLEVRDCTGGDCSGLADQDPAPGRFRVVGLEDGDYTLTETEAPQYYQKLTAPLQFTVTNGESSRGRDWSIGNDPIPLRFQLNFPLTGGQGSTLFLVLGGGMISTALIMGHWFRKRRRR